MEPHPFEIVHLTDMKLSVASCNVLLAADTLSPPSCLPVKLQKIDTYENIAILQKIPIYMLTSSLVHQ